jgi:uncharacterized membrane protein YkvA (DUF1232 family)
MSDRSGSRRSFGPEFAPEMLGRPLTAEEMDAIRRAAQNEHRLGLALLTHLKRFAKRIPFIMDALSAWYCAIDPATPARVKGVLLAALAYFVLPFDVVPDIMPFLGFSDDAAVLAAAIAAVSSSITDTHRDKAKRRMDDL